MLSVVPNQTPRDYVTAEPAQHDSLGDLIRQQNAQANIVPQSHPQASHAVPKKGEKGYGATDRRALDRLFETSGGSAKP
jgi:hypothetical protein